MATEKSSGARGGAGKKSASKSTQKKATQKGSSQKKSSSTRTAKKTSASGSGASRGRSAPRAEAPRRTSAAQVAESAVHQLSELTSKVVEGVTGLERTEDGWKVELDVLELRRVPNTTDVLASYEVTVDSDGDLESYRRLHRYVRGAAGEEGA
jgi:hypothetical protein